ncbi:TlpA disulfide reductase family protein [Mangrovivirga sp. M17]|uniref:TlpA disulfide reductase family protein n=1 Tax=Mangrovivirga halotolerans TaxID=2993936 RepID=A0ABT3RU85_9BACT|nr:TlpA disulfide reductase family protein [Mangrovivirga halotolerans]MCX2744913.1 TlpA disulfide reductase family protein [Mangrovivirga halotolerans]
MRNIYILIFAVFFSLNTKGQNVEKISIGELEKLINQENENVLIFNFWATWCKPCLKEIPAFEKINENGMVSVHLVSIDFINQFEKRVVPYVENRNLDSKVLFLAEENPNSWMPRISNEWSGAIPATLFVYKGKKYFEEKEFTLEELNEYINKIRN